MSSSAFCRRSLRTSIRRDASVVAAGCTSGPNFASHLADAGRVDTQAPSGLDHTVVLLVDELDRRDFELTGILSSRHGKLLSPTLCRLWPVSTILGEAHPGFWLTKWTITAHFSTSAPAATVTSSALRWSMTWPLSRTSTGRSLSILKSFRRSTITPQVNHTVVSGERAMSKII